MKAALRGELEEDVAGLLRVHAWRPEVLSLYLSVPADRAEMRGLPRVAGFPGGGGGRRAADGGRPQRRGRDGRGGRERLGRAHRGDLHQREPRPA